MQRKMALNTTLMQSAKWQEEIGYSGFYSLSRAVAKKSQPTSNGRVVAFNRVQVGRFYDILQETYEKQHIDQSHIDKENSVDYRNTVAATWGWWVNLF